MFKRSKVSAGVLAALGGALLGSVSPAMAQGETVVITGSRILKSDLVGTTPVVSVNLEQMGNLGIENFADMATQLPQFAPSFGASRTQSTFSGVATSGLNLANLRNLGSVRSLVLINGRRAAGGTSTSTSVDFNNIPTANIERIEIITGGASAVYGSDAVAGVINIITKRNLEGVELGLSYGESSEGDNKNPSASIVMGGKFGTNGRGMLTMEFDKQGRVSCADRYICAEDFLWTSPANPVRGPNAYSGVGLGGRFFVGSSSYVRRNNTFTDANGNLIPFSTPIDGYNRNADRDIAIPTKRVLAAAELEYKLGMGISAFGEFNFGETNIDSQFEGHPFQSNQPGNRYGTLNPNIPLNNPFIPQALRDAITAYNANPPVSGNPPTPAPQITEIVWWQRFNDAGGPRGADSSRRMTRSVTGLKGEFDSIGGFGRNFRWELSHTLARTTVNLNTEGLVNTANLYHGLRVEADPDNPGQFRCVDAAARAQGCVPINPFADYTPAMKKSLRIGSMAIGTSSLNDTLLTLTGTVADLPAGSLRAAVGAERRTFSGFLDRDVVVNNALATGNVISDTDFAKTKTDEVFAEVFVPILADKPFVQSLNFEGAVRKSDAGNSNYSTWNYGGDWEPVNGLRLRAKQARSVRAPLPGELSGVGQTFGVVQDPCTQARRNANPTRAANCMADGVPADYVPPQTVEQGVGGLSGGNPNLKPEQGDTLTYGIVWEPAFAKGLSIAIDRFEIDVEKIISTVSRQIAVNTCYDTPNRLLCNVVTRGTNVQVPNANYVLTQVNEQLENIAKLSVAGVDIDVRYNTALPGGWGDLSLGMLGTIYDKATYTTVGAPINLLGQAGGSTSDQGWIKFTANANIGWRYGGFSANWNIRHIGAADMAATGANTTTTSAGYPRIPAHTYHNLRVGFQLSKNAEVYGGVTNIADKQPPFFASGSAGTQALDTVPGYYDVFGRSYFVGAKFKF
jgi:outer membrane receptor protein involved in Fe transport